MIVPSSSSSPRTKSNFLLSISHGVASFIVLMVPAVAQIEPPAIEWEQTFGGSDDDFGLSVPNRPADRGS